MINKFSKTSNFTFFSVFGMMGAVGSPSKLGDTILDLGNTAG